jgi:conjugal transfer pilus assembly protein TraF
MIRTTLLLALLSLPMIGSANFTDSPAEGFHWYTSTARSTPPSASHPLPSPSVVHVESQMTPQQQLHFLTNITRNTLATAILNPTEENAAHYMRAQQFWAKQDQRFVQSWQLALLHHPELDYRLNFPTNNSAIPIRNDEQNVLIEKTLKAMQQHFGLIFFYRGHSSVCQRFAQVLLPFVNQENFAMISVTTDGKPIIGLPNPKSLPMSVLSKRLPLRSKYLPALFLVNMKTKKMQPLSYGFIALSDLKTRFLDVATNFGRYSYRGLGERTQ